MKTIYKEIWESCPPKHQHEVRSGWSQLLEPDSNTISVGTMCSGSDILVAVGWEFVSIIAKPVWDAEGHSQGGAACDFRPLGQLDFEHMFRARW